MKGLTDGAGGDAGVGRDAAAAEAMPRGIANAYAFQAFNATSWSVILGTPMLLYLRGLGASGTVLGIAVALIPLFSALQIPAAAIAERTGYKSFVVRGWGSRSTFILGIALVTLLPVPLGPGRESPCCSRCWPVLPPSAAFPYAGICHG